MDKKPFLKILEFIDKNFHELYWQNSDQECDELEKLFNKTKFAEEFLDMDEFISYNTGNLNYAMNQSLIVQYGELEEKSRLKVIEVLFNILYFSNIDEVFKVKIASFLNRYQIIFNDDKEYRRILFGGSEKFLEGSFGKVFLVDDKLVKKQLKSNYWENKDIASRFKNEFKIQKRLVELDARVLSVYDYDSINNSFLMEKADMDLYDLLDKNILDFEGKIDLSRQLLDTMKIAHHNNIIHRDLHPGNILIKGNILFVSDFGFAKDSEHLRSKLSTMTPKPIHQFIALEGLSDFRSLDKISDIYSIGKVIDFIFGNGKLGTAHPYKLLVEKSTMDIRTERFNSIDLLTKSFNNLYDVYLKGEDINKIKKYIDNGIHDLSVENYLLKLAKDDKITDQIVANGWSNLARLLLMCNINNQITIINNINVHFASATGYGGWGNYDYFGRIAYNMIINSDSQDVIRNAHDILNKCAKVRFSSANLLAKVPHDKIQFISK